MKTLLFCFLALGMIASVAITGCAPATVSTPTPTPTPKTTISPAPPAAVSPTVAAASKPAWQAEWERTLTEAKKEGKVVIYTTYGPDWRNAFHESLSQKYGIEVETVSGRAGEITERFMRERKAGTKGADLITMGVAEFLEALIPGAVLQPIPGALILPEAVEPKVWAGGGVPWLDPDTKTVFYYQASPNPSIVVNTELVKNEEISGYKDLLNPKWKGKIVLNDPTVAGAGQSGMSMVGYKLMGWEYLEQLIKQEPVLQRDTRLGVEWVARGRYPVIVNPSQPTVADFVRTGAPIRAMEPSEGTYLGVGSAHIGFSEGAPHTNAAKVFLNFLITKEGQTIASKITGYQSLRTDVPTDFLNPLQVRQPGKEYFSSNDPGFLKVQRQVAERVVQMFKPLVQ